MGFPSSSVSRFQRQIVRCLADNLAPKCRQETANQRPDVFALLSPRSKLRKSMIVNAPLIRGTSVNLFPNRFATMSTSLVRSVMTFPTKFVTISQPLLQSMLTTSSAPMLVPENVLQPLDKSALMLLSRCQGRPMRLNARLSIPRNVRRPVAEDMETNYFYMICRLYLDQ